MYNDLVCVKCLLSLSLLYYACIYMPSLFYMTIQFAIPKCPIEIYAHVVSFSKVKSTLSNRTYSIKILSQKLVNLS